MARKASTETQVKNILVPIIQAIGRSGKLGYLILFLVIGYFAYQYFSNREESGSIEMNSTLIEKQIKNVGKLIVTEGHYAEVLTYKDQQKYFLDLVTFEKKALIVANADAIVSYDLRLVKYKIDEKAKAITIIEIPKPELKINQELHFYDINQSRFNPFGASDYNKINKKVKEQIKKKIEKSTLMSNAQNRLISELSKILILTNSMGWKLQYKGKQIANESDFKL